MEKVAPLGPVYQAGTLSGNPVAISAGLATLKRLDAALYARLETLGARLQNGFERAIAKRGVEACVQRVGSMITLFFTKGPVQSWTDAKACDTKTFGRWHAAMLDRGVYWPPSQFEAAFVSGAHTESDIDQAVAAADESLAGS
jgi:glutamate-1-semialdehyde 2,1-aminomutase